jgi:hypothetical protein
MNRTILRCTNKISGTTLKDIARSRKMHIVYTRKELLMKLYNDKYEESEEIWYDLACTINELNVEKIITRELKRYWNHHEKEFTYEIPLEIYYSSQELYNQDSWIDHA